MVLGIVVLASALLVDHARAHLLVADRQAILEGELWRLLTGPLVPGSLHALIGDAAALGLLALLPAPGPRRLPRAVAWPLAVVVITGGTLALHPGALATHGLGGVVHALLGARVVAGLRGTDPGPRRVWAALGVALGLVLAVEAATGSRVLPAPGLPADGPDVTVRAVGGVLGAVAGLLSRVGPGQAPIRGRGAAALAALALVAPGLLPVLVRPLVPGLASAAYRAGGRPYAIGSPPARLSCGPRTACYLAEHRFGRACDPGDVSRRIWSLPRGTDIRDLAAEVTRLSGRPHRVEARVRAPSRLACLVRCGEVVALVSVGDLRPRSHFVVLLRVASGRVRWHDVNRGAREAPLAVFDRAARIYESSVVAEDRCLASCPDRG
jgi:hypothetical protein